MDVVLALVAALLFALGTVLQQRAGLEAPSEGASSGLLLRMAKRPVWLAGIAADGLGFVAQAAALGIGRLAVVQPLLIASVVFALPLGASSAARRSAASTSAPPVLVVAALAAFLLIAEPSGGSDDAPLNEWLVAGGICAVICVPLVLLGRVGSPPRRAALAWHRHRHPLRALGGPDQGRRRPARRRRSSRSSSSWHLYALVVVGYASMTLNQMALNTGALAPAVATSLAFDPITSVVLGVTLLDESLRTTAIEGVGLAVALAAALAGMAILARSQAQAEPPARFRPGHRLGSPG